MLDTPTIVTRDLESRKMTGDDLSVPGGYVERPDPAINNDSRGIPFWLVIMAPALGMVPLLLVFLGVKFVSLFLARVGVYLDYILDHHKFVIVISGATIAYIMYKFKDTHQFWYGFLELSLAIMAIGNFAANDNPDDMFTFIDWVAGFFGPIYLAVRGFTNIEEGRRKRINRGDNPSPPSS
jgi:hypothetical protein